MSDAVDFYDGLAPAYHVIYGDRWDEAVVRQGAVLARVIREVHPIAATVLDCSCGIGTQSIGLALEGFRVTGTDVSPRSVARARLEAQRFGVRLTLRVADFRELAGITGPFDVVLSADNALPHLLDDTDLTRALATMRSRLSAGGLLLITMRDYDRALAERPPTAPPLLVPGPPRRVVVRLHDWDDPASPLYTVRFLICTEREGTWEVEHHAARYRAITRQAFTGLVEAAGFKDITWRSGPEAAYHQPVMTATAS